MGSAAHPGQIGSTQAQRDDEEKKQAQHEATYGPGGANLVQVNNQGDGGWFGGALGDASKAWITSPFNLAEHTVGAVGDVAQGHWADAGRNVVAGGQDFANLTTFGAAEPIVGDSGVPGTGAIPKGVAAVSDAVKNGGIGFGGPVDQGAKDAVANDVAASRSARDQLLNAYNTSQPRAVPLADAPAIAPVTNVQRTAVGPAAGIAPTTVGGAAQAGAAPAVTATGIAPTTVGQAAQFNASTVAPTAAAAAGQAVATGIDTSQQAQFRNAQQGLVQALQGAAAGTAPSAAQAQLQRANDQAIQTQASLAAGAHGTSRLTQRLLSADNIADLQQKNASDSAILKANEMSTARGQLGTALEGARGQDIGLATTGAQLATDVSKTNAGLTTTTNISNADRAAAASMKNAELQQAAASGNAAAINELKSRQAQITSSENIAGAANALDASKANAGNATTLNVANMQAQNRMTELQAQITSQQGIATAEQQNELTKLQAQITADASKTDAGAANDQAKEQARLQLQQAIANQDAALKARGLDDSARQALLQAFAEQQAAALGWDKSEAALNVARSTANKQLAGSIIGGVAGAGATIFGA